MRRAFTLMELMVVVGIMAFLGLAATNGYNALQRGIAERGAVDAASALLKAAKERAMVDRVPTAVFFFNRMVSEATSDDHAVIVGEAVAIRRAGRITRVQGKHLYDEFGDLDCSYDRTTKVDELEERKGFRLWRFDDKPMTKMQYSVVADGVLYDVDVPGVSFMKWSNLLDEDSADGALNGQNSGINSEISSGIWKIRSCAFYDLGTSDHPPASWQAGNGYGFEFQTLRLPAGFVFGSTVPTDVGKVLEVKACSFDPENYSADETIDVYVCQADANGVPHPSRRAGTASSKDNAAK